MISLSQWAYIVAAAVSGFIYAALSYLNQSQGREILAAILAAADGFRGPDVLRSSAEVVAYAGLNPRQHQSGTSIDRVTRISKIGNAVLRAALYMPAMSAMRYNPAVAALVTRLKSRGRLNGKQIVIAAMRKLLVLCFGVLKTGKPFDPKKALPTPPTT
jgi:transposase